MRLRSLHRSAALRTTCIAALTIAFAVVGQAAIDTGVAGATPVCTDGYNGGPPLTLCGGRVFPESAGTVGYVQFQPQPVTGFREYADGLAFLAQQYPRWISVFTLAQKYHDPNAVSPGPDGIRAGEPGDTHDGRDILVVKVTDHQVPDAAKQTLFFSLSIHGNERGGLEGGVRTVEDLGMAATDGTTEIVDGVPNYDSVSGITPEFHRYKVADVLAKEVVYFVDFNPDGWAVGDLVNPTGPRPYERGNTLGTDLNRQMPTVGFIDAERNPLEEREMSAGLRYLRDLAAATPDGRVAHGADIHGELQSGAYVDIMYPAGQFDSIQHRRHMTFAERVKSVIDATLFGGIVNEIEEATGGNEAASPDATFNAIPTKPAQWATVWDSLGYTDTGFLGDYIATDLAFSGMDYEIFLNHTVPDKAWTVYLQENHINATRAIVKTSMAYTLTQRTDVSAATVRIPTIGMPGYVANPTVVTDTDANGGGAKPGPQKAGTGANGSPVSQAHYSATQMRWFTDESPLLEHPFAPLAAADIANDAKTLDAVDSLVLADVSVPPDPKGRPVDRAAYFANLRSWVQRGGNLVLTDRAVHAAADLGLVKADDVEDIDVYQPYTDITDFGHPLVARLRANARQLVEATLVGYPIGNDASPMTVIAPDAFAAAKGTVAGLSEGSVSVGAIPLGDGRVVIVGGALPTPTEDNDHRYGLRDYALTYSGTFIMENALKWDAPNLGVGGGQAGGPPGSDDELPATGGAPSGWLLAVLGAFVVVSRLSRTARRGRAPAS